MLVEKNIPIPKEVTMFAVYRYPFREMEAGDSFLVDSTKGFEGTISRHKAVDTARKFASRNPGYRFDYRMTDDGIRIWRV